MGIGPFAKFFVKRVGELNTYFTHLNLQVRVEIRPGEAPECQTCECQGSDGGYVLLPRHSRRPRPIQEPYRHSDREASLAIEKKSVVACRPNTDSPTDPVRLPPSVRPRQFGAAIRLRIPAPTGPKPRSRIGLSPPAII